LLSAVQGAKLIGSMLYALLTANRHEILVRARKRIAARDAPKPTEVELTDGLPLFLDQLGDALLLARAGGMVTHDSISKSASTHVTPVLGRGLTVECAIHDYGALCQVLTNLALERDAPLTAEDFITLDLCLDDAIACPVTKWGTV
jgi:hypothetical protein